VVATAQSRSMRRFFDAIASIALDHGDRGRQ